jgi:hypothetical protein
MKRNEIQDELRKSEVVPVAARLPGERGDHNSILRPADVAQRSVQKTELATKMDEAGL